LKASKILNCNGCPSGPDDSRFATPDTARQAADGALDVVADILAGGKNSRVDKRVVYQMQIAQDVRTVVDGRP
jgi:hypothetical protein